MGEVNMVKPKMVSVLVLRDTRLRIPEELAIRLVKESNAVLEGKHIKAEKVEEIKDENNG